MTTKLTKTNIYDTVADVVLTAAFERWRAAEKGRAAETDRAAFFRAVDEETHMIILNQICCAAVSPCTMEAGGYVAEAARKIAERVAQIRAAEQAPNPEGNAP